MPAFFVMSNCPSHRHDKFPNFSISPCICHCPVPAKKNRKGAWPFAAGARVSGGPFGNTYSYLPRVAVAQPRAQKLQTANDPIRTPCVYRSFSVLYDRSYIVVLHCRCSFDQNKLQMHHSDKRTSSFAKMPGAPDQGDPCLSDTVCECVHGYLLFTILARRRLPPFVKCLFFLLLNETLGRQPSSRESSVHFQPNQCSYLI